LARVIPPQRLTRERSHQRTRDTDGSGNEKARWVAARRQHFGQEPDYETDEYRPNDAHCSTSFCFCLRGEQMSLVNTRRYAG
jgi:hypothetical protein